MTEVVKEFKTQDGLGAMLWKKIYAMSYAKHSGKLFEDTPIDWFIIHESDGIDGEDDPKYHDLLFRFNNVLYNPWKNINFDTIADKTLCPHVGAGANPPGFIDTTDFLLEAPAFNKFSDMVHNSIVIHIRRGNAVPGNPRYVPDDFYVNVLKNIPKIIEKYGLEYPEVIICTDSTTNSFHPKGELQEFFWQQPHLNKNESGIYPHTSINFDLFKSIYPNVKIIDNLDTYDAFILMLTAKMLIVGNSAFSQSAGLLSTNMVIGMPLGDMDIRLNIFKNKVGELNAEGNLNEDFRN
jgi:hypothetical protein